MEESKSTFLLKGDIKELLNMVPIGSRLNCNLDRLPAKDRAHHPVALIKSRNGFVNSRNGKLFPFKAVIRDVENRVIQLSAVLEKAEQNPNFNLQIDHESGKLFAYDGRFEDIQKRSEYEQLRTDTMYIFRDTLPKILVDQGLVDSPAKISGFVYDKVVAKFKNHYRNAHGYSVDALKAVKTALDDPVAIIKVPSPDGSVRVAVVTQIPDHRQALSMVIMQHDQDSGDNFVCSVYGKTELINFLKRHQDEGNLMYIRDALCLRGQAAVEGKSEKLEQILEKYQVELRGRKEEKELSPDEGKVNKRGGNSL